MTNALAATVYRQERNVNNELVKFNKSEFRVFVEADYPIGLSTTLETLEALCGHEPKVMDFIAQAKQGKVGRPIGSTGGQVNAQGNVTDNSVESTELKKKYHSASTSAYAYNRLRAEAYDIDPQTGEILGVKNEHVLVPTNARKRLK